MMDVYEQLECAVDDNYLAHHGILGMRWGVRRYQNADGSLTVAGKKRYSKVLSDGEVSLLEKRHKITGVKGDYDIYSNGKKVGKTIVDYDTSNGSSKNAHIDWLGIKENERRKGYGQKTMNLLIDDAAKEGFKYINLEAAGLDPAAKHVYEKKGFKIIESIDNDLWNGLVVMQKDLTAPNVGDKREQTRGAGSPNAKHTKNSSINNRASEVYRKHIQ